MSDNLLDCIDLSEIPGADLIPKAKPAPTPERKSKAERKAMTKREPVPDVIDCPPQTMSGEGGDSAGEDRQAGMAKEEPKPLLRVKSRERQKNPAKGIPKRKERAGERDGESDIGEGSGEEWEHPTSIPKGSHKKWVPLGRPPNRTYTAEGWERVLSGARLGMGMEKLWALSGMGENPFKRLLHAEPWRVEVIKEARDAGEHSLLVRVSECEHGWQGSAWLLERARGYVARASLEHTGKGGSQLSIAHEVVGMLGGKEVG